ncbi:MAG: hypothetical protein ACKVWV_09320 [Planctomycetota bacterium]
MGDVDFAPAEAVDEARETSHVVLVVHGIGEQRKYETLQEVIFQMGRVKHGSWFVPLGRLYSVLQQSALFSDLRADGFEFAEVYWADIAVAHKSKASSSLVRWASRVSHLLDYVDAKSPNYNGEQIDVKRLASVVDDTLLIAHISRFLIARARVETQGFVDSAEHFIASYQLFSDFEDIRAEIVGAFTGQLERIYELKKNEHVEVHILAHSLGSVIAVCGLSDLLRRGKKEIVGTVASLTTIGSPIDLFATLHRDILGLEFLKRDEAARAIRWLNLVEIADPIASSLKVTKCLLERSNSNLFDIRSGSAIVKPTDHQYCSSPVPGGAHMRYWADAYVYRTMSLFAINGVFFLKRRPWSVVKSAAAALIPGTIAFGFSVTFAVLAVYWAFHMELVQLRPPTIVGHALQDLTLRLCSALSLMCFGQVLLGSLGRSAVTQFAAMAGLATIVASGCLADETWDRMTFLRIGDHGGIKAIAIFVSIGVWQWGIDQFTPRNRLLSVVSVLVALAAINAFALHSVPPTDLDWRARMRDGFIVSTLAALSWWLATLWWRFSVVWTKYVIGRRHIDVLADRWGYVDPRAQRPNRNVFDFLRFAWKRFARS